MKKTTKFVAGSFLLFLAGSYGMRLAATPTFELIEETGNRSALDPVVYHMDLATLNGRVKLDVQKGEVVTSLKEMKSYKAAEYEARQDDQRMNDEQYAEMEFYDKEIQKEDWIRVQDNAFDECGEEQRTLTSAKMSYYLYDQGISIQTGLVLYANDTIEMTERRCANYDMEYDTVYELSILNNERYFHHNDYTRYTDGTTYFMPVQTPSIQGINHIYEINDGKQKELVTLTEGRSYEEMHLIKNQLVVLSHTEDTFYTTIYGLDGTIQTEFTYAYTNDSVMKSFYTSNYLIYSDDKQYWIYDASQLSLDHKTYGETGMQLEDVYEEAGILYLSASEKDEQEVLHLMVYDDETVLYHGKIVVLNKQNESDKSESYPIDVVVWGYFER